MSCANTTFCTKCSQYITNNNFKRHVEKCNGPKSLPLNPGCRGGWNKGLTKETDNRVARQAETHSRNILSGKTKNPGGAIQTPEGLKKLSTSAKQRGLGGHTSKTKIFFRKNDGSFVYLQSSYEVSFAKILEALGIEWNRPDPVMWVDDNGTEHRYYADFVANGIYFDTKNDYLIQKDLPKITKVIEQNRIDLRVVPFKRINEEYIRSILLPKQ